MEQYNDYDGWLLSQGAWSAQAELAKVRKYLDSADSILSLVIKASLVFEASMDRLFSGKFAEYSDELRKSTFRIKIEIYRGFGGDPELLSWLTQFNSIRNKYAHSLIDLPEEKLIRLCREAVSDLDEPWVKDLEGFDLIDGAVTRVSGWLLSDVATLLEYEVVGGDLMVDDVED